MANRVLKFEKNADFYFNRHLKAFDKGDLIDSLSNIRSAIEKDPTNSEYQFYLAETLSEMFLYEDSNYILFKLLEKNERFDGDVVFDIAVNLFNLGDYDKSEETFLKYISDYPDGTRIEDAQEAYELLLESHQEQPPIIKDATLESANLGKKLLDSGKFAEAVDIMTPLAKNNPGAAFLQNNLALAHFCLGETSKAIAISENMLKLQPTNIHTICNLAIFYSTEDLEKAREYCTLLDGEKTDDEADLNKMLLTYCEVGLHENVYQIAKDILEINPYEKRLLFIFAAACSNTGRLSESIDAYMKILYIDPSDTIAQYYKNKVQRVYDVSAGIPVEQQYIYQVPISEVHRRLSYLHAESSKGELNMRLLWAGDENFANLLVWGLYFSDHEIKKVCSEIIAAFHDEKSDEILRRYLMDSLEPDTIKSELFITMNKFGYKQPYLAYICGKLAEVRVGSIDAPQGLNKSSTEVLTMLAENEPCSNNAVLLQQVVETVDKYYAAQMSVPRLVNKKAWAAAFLYYTIKDADIPLDITLGDICNIFEASQTSTIRCLKLIHKSIGEHNE